MTPKIDMHCPSCDSVFEVPVEWAGKLAECKCGNRVRIADGPRKETGSTPSQVAPAATPPPSPSATAGQTNDAVLDATVSKFSYSSPDEDGDTSIGLKLQITNTAPQNIEYLHAVTILFDADQNPIYITRNEEDVFIGAEDSEEIELYVGYINIALAGGQPDELTARIYLNACRSDHADLGSHAIADTPFAVSGTQLSQAIGESTTVRGLSTWSTRPDEDEGTVDVHVSALTENMTDDHIYKIQLKGKLLDSGGREIEEMEQEEELPAGSTTVLESYFWGIKPKRLSGASITLAAIVHSRIATGELAASQITIEDDD